MFNIASLFAQAEQAFQLGRLEEAERLLAQVRRVAVGSPEPLHLSALVAKRAGRSTSSKNFFELALRLRPDDPQILTNYANLLGEINEPVLAFACYDRAVRAAPHFAEARYNRALLHCKLGQADKALADFEQLLATGSRSAKIWSAYAGALRDLGRLADAAHGFDEALRLEPNRLVALHGRARVAMERGDLRASEYYRAAIAGDPASADLRLGLSEALEAEGKGGAIDLLAAAVEQRPEWSEGHLTLARMRWEAGHDRDFTESFEKAVAKRPKDQALWAAYASALAGATLYKEAANVAERGARLTSDAASLLLLEAAHASEAGEIDRAERLFARLPHSLPGREVPEIRHSIRVGDLERALRIAEQARKTCCWDVAVWALAGLLWRIKGDARAQWLHGQDGLVATRELGLSAADITAIAERLRSLHRTRAHPLGQSLRGGTQTRGRLFSREEPEIALLHAAISAAVADYWKALPPRDDTHPLLRHRDADPRLDGSWSVRLTDSGFHVSHIHPHGLISSACYLVVPETTRQEGWLEIGCTPEGLDLPLAPLFLVKPAPGKMALFPSTLFHGTRPFAAGERLTAAFDVVAE